MYRVTLAPMVDTFNKKDDQWFKTVEDRFNIYTGAANPAVSEVPQGQWVIHRNTVANTTKLWTNWSNTLYSISLDGTTYAPATSGTSLLKGNGSGGFSNAVSGTDYAPATSGASIVYGNGSGGFSNVTVSTGLNFAAGVLTSTVAGTVTSVTASAPLASSGGATPNITAANLTGTGSNLVTDSVPTITNLYTNNLAGFNQAAVTSKSAGATLTAAEQKNGILQYTGAGAANITTPTASALIAALPSNFPTSSAFYWYIVNTGAGTVTVVAGSGVTLTGVVTVAGGASGGFIIRVTGSSAATFYRIS